MSRSGNHAIINWILAQASGRVCFLNCAEAGTNPFHTARPLDGDGVAFKANFPLDLAAEQRGEHGAKDLLVHSYEDTFLRPLAYTPPQREALTGSALQRMDVLILRDPYNLFASRLASGMGSVSSHVAARVWCQHAREFSGSRSHLRRDLVTVDYNRWATSHSYRRGVSHRLGLEFDDASSRHVPVTAGGSSFDGTTRDGAAGSMAVLDRWRGFMHDPAYRAVFNDTVHRLSRHIFGVTPATEAFASREAA